MCSSSSILIITTTNVEYSESVLRHFCITLDIRRGSEAILMQIAKTIGLTSDKMTKGKNVYRLYDYPYSHLMGAHELLGKSKLLV